MTINARASVIEQDGAVTIAHPSKQSLMTRREIEASAFFSVMSLLIGRGKPAQRPRSMVLVKTSICRCSSSTSGKPQKYVNWTYADVASTDAARAGRFSIARPMSRGERRIHALERKWASFKQCFKSAL